VVDLISLKPFDMETITNSVRKTRKVIIVEECMKTGGIGASLSAVINETLFDELDHQARSPIYSLQPFASHHQPLVPDLLMQHLLSRHCLLWAEASV